jgi:hypothetical protein
MAGYPGSTVEDEESLYSGKKPQPSATTPMSVQDFIQSCFSPFKFTRRSVINIAIN